ncbi:glycine betaine ABC transporter substrate-binding protein [uncultured Paludibaculum sp.]|uniref:ABC transporter substrate-binding protein n=1 Tax=uncultured Paludibaculum sp. TaxID=1765020 RepID=UPI002AAB4FDE|nr:glycine betaine ABC transporter substrate-binding protein [uncultured Paludibaculum sp.]
MPGFRRRPLVWTLCLGSLLVSACSRPAPQLIVGSKEGPENQILGEILAQHLSKQLPSLQIVRRFGLGNSAFVNASLLNGDISLYPEYSGTALFQVLKIQPDRGDDPLLDQLREGYRTNFRCEWFGPLGFRDKRVFLVPRGVAEKRQVRTLSEAGANHQGWAIGSAREFRDRPDGLVLLTRKYEFQLSAPARILDSEALFTALGKEEITLGATRASDPRLGKDDVVQLEDDQQVFPLYEAGIVVKIEALETHPQLANVLKQLYGKITIESMRSMMRRVEFENAAAADLATEFLRTAGL